MTSAAGVLVAGTISSFLTASAMTFLQLPGAALPVVLAPMFAAMVWALRGMDADWRQPQLERHEQVLLAFAVMVGLLRLGPYAYQYVAGVLVAPVTWDDNWHFQELASLVNAERFPPRLNFAHEAYFHFYYLAWVPAAAISSLLQTLTGTPMIKLGYALGALLLDVGVAWALIVVVRHFCAAPGRKWALAALVIAGAAIDGLFAVRNLVVLGHPQHAEWWQLGLLVRNSFSGLSTSLIWVPHHMIGAMAILLAVVVATEPVTLAPREGHAPFIVAGLLIGAAAFASIFAFAGGLIALLPLLWELLRHGDRRRIACLMVACVMPAVPLAYIYLGAEARGGFVIGQAFAEWSRATGKPAMGLAGLVIAFALMVMEVGWLYVVGRGLDRGEASLTRLRTMAAASALMLASTAVLAFSGSNNWALRATIVPVVLLACYVGRGLAGSLEHGSVRLDPAIVLRTGTIALAFAAVAHLNETALLVGRSAAAPAFATETDACKTAILAANRAPQSSGTAAWLASCKDPHSAYHVERAFDKPVLSPVDRELMGRGFGFLSPSGKAWQQTGVR